jgi:saccharopine dehydrogenase-like NADP-dependent oxidoreductase
MEVVCNCSTPAIMMNIIIISMKVHVVDLSHMRAVDWMVSPTSGLPGTHVA